MIFETKISSIGLPRRSDQVLYVVSRTDTVIRTPGIRGLHFSPPYKKFRPRNFNAGVRTIVSTPKPKCYGSTTLPLRTLLSIRNSGWRSMVVPNRWEAERCKESEKEIERSGWQLDGRKEYKRVKEWIVKVMVFSYSLLESPTSDTNQLIWTWLYCW